MKEGACPSRPKDSLPFLDLSCVSKKHPATSLLLHRSTALIAHLFSIDPNCLQNPNRRPLSSIDRQPSSTSLTALFSSIDRQVLLHCSRPSSPPSIDRFFSIAHDPLLLHRLTGFQFDSSITLKLDFEISKALSMPAVDNGVGDSHYDFNFCYDVTKFDTMPMNWVQRKIFLYNVFMVKLEPRIRTPPRAMNGFNFVAARLMCDFFPIVVACIICTFSPLFGSF
ncbi:hypothetical protein Ccrd_023565 [Cynara cardunculus var. scolymus]|uniref:Uncharacterized protein n=1 Tax=Cynara cardunculus var. scolymus TaxID=59895 RepID=A0A124SDV6_CYNCS|nr:hypothetical protein Ccrd_023565 [Cynara cardunculus var. scolymus]